MNRRFDRKESLKGNEASVRMAHAKRDERWEEICFLLDSGMHPLNIVTHVGISAEALSNQAYRAGWNERAKPFNNIRKRKSRAKK